MGHFKDLKAWQHARSLAVLSKAAIARLPEGERDSMADQWRRASYSVVLNIAEGASRRGTREFRRFLDIARASLHEIEALLDLALALEYFPARGVSEDRSRAGGMREDGLRPAPQVLRRSETRWALTPVNRVQLGVCHLP